MSTKSYVSEEQAFSECLSAITKLETLEQQLAVLGNLIIQLGLARIDFESPSGDSFFDIDRVAEIAIQDLKQNGETIANALVRQGLIFMTWIQKE